MRGLPLLAALLGLAALGCGAPDEPPTATAEPHPAALAATEPEAALGTTARPPAKLRTGTRSRV